MKYLEIIRIINIYSIVLPILIGLFFYKYLKFSERIILSFLITVGLFDVLLFILSDLNINNLMFYQIYNKIEYVFIATFYLSTLKYYFRYKYIRSIYFTIFIISIIVSYYKYSMLNIDSISSTLVSLTFIFSAIVLLFKSQFSENSNLLLSSTRLINITILFYYSTTFFIYLLSDWIILNQLESFQNIWIINTIASLITNILFTLALWKARPQTK